MNKTQTVLYVAPKIGVHVLKVRNSVLTNSTQDGTAPAFESGDDINWDE